MQRPVFVTFIQHVHTFLTKARLNDSGETRHTNTTKSDSSKAHNTVPQSCLSSLHMEELLWKHQLVSIQPCIANPAVKGQSVHSESFDISMSYDLWMTDMEDSLRPQSVVVTWSIHPPSNRAAALTPCDHRVYWHISK